MNDVVIAGAGPNGLMLAGELELAGIRPVVLESLAGPNPQRRANGITGQAVRLLDHRGLYSVLAGTPDPPQPSPWAMFAAMALDLTGVPDPQHFMFPVQQPRLVQMLAERVRDNGADLRWGHRLAGFEQHPDGVVVQVDGPDGRYELPAKYLVGADGGSSQTRKFAGIDFPGMTSHDAVARMAFGVVPPDDWVDPVTGALRFPAGVVSHPHRSTGPSTAFSLAVGWATGRCSSLWNWLGRPKKTGSTTTTRTTLR